MISINWKTVLGALFIVSGLSNILSNLGPSLLLLLLGGLLVFTGIKSRSKKNSQYHDLYAQAMRKDDEHNLARSLPDLSPESVGKDKRYYHYKDVNIHVVWQFCGQYDKSCESAGMKRGDSIDLVFDHFENDSSSVAIVWNGETIGHMLDNRMRTMVHQWKSKKKPVLCFVSHVGGETKVLLEFSFYGYVKYKK